MALPSALLRFFGLRKAAISEGRSERRAKQTPQRNRSQRPCLSSTWPALTFVLTFMTFSLNWLFDCGSHPTTRENYR
jgi:hypothetical protein